MANIKSKEKNIKRIKKRTIRNSNLKSSTRTAIKKAKIAILNKEDNIPKKMAIAHKAINTAISKGVFHKNNGARKQSRLDAFYKKNND